MKIRFPDSVFYWKWLIISNMRHFVHIISGSVGFKFQIKINNNGCDFSKKTPMKKAKNHNSIYLWFFVNLTIDSIFSKQTISSSHKNKVTSSISFSPGFNYEWTSNISAKLFILQLSHEFFIPSETLCTWLWEGNFRSRSPLGVGSNFKGVWNFEEIIGVWNCLKFPELWGSLIVKKKQFLGSENILKI